MDRGVMDVVINALQYKKNSSGIGIMLREAVRYRGVHL